MTWWRLCSEELLSVMVRPVLYVAVLLLSILTIATVVRGRGELDEQNSHYNDQIQERAQARLLVVNPSGRVTDAGLRVLRRPTPRMLLVRRNVPVLPSGWDFGPAGAEARPPYPPAAVGSAVAGTMDLEEIVLVFGGLLCIGLGLFRAIDERVSGWSLALLALPVPWRTLVMARLVGGCASVTLLLFVWFGIVAVTAGFAEPALATELRWALLDFLVPTWIYLVTLYMLGLAVASWIPRPQPAVVAVLLAWLTVTFILPQSWALLARTADSRLTRQTMERERRAAFADVYQRLEDEMGVKIAAQVAPGPALMKLVKIDEPAVANLELDTMWMEGARTARQLALGLEAEWQAIQGKRRDAQRRGLAASPAAALTVILAELAGSGEASYSAWEWSATSHHRRLAAALFDDRPAANTRVPVAGGKASFSLERHEWRPYEVLPVFEEPTFEGLSRWTASRWAFAALIFYFVAAILLAYLGGTSELMRKRHDID